MLCCITEYNFLDFKCYGHPTKLQQDWVEIFIGNKIYYVQCLLFVDIAEKPQETIRTYLYNVQKAGQYALVHFMQYDIFRDDVDNLQLYGTPQVNFFQDEDCFLVRGWSKHTDCIDEPLRRNQEVPTPTLALIPVSCILKPMTAIPDTGSSFPHSWLLARPREDWPDMFVEQMNHDVTIQQHRDS